MWDKDWAYPLSPCVGPLADASSYRYSSAYGHALACIDYGAQGEARAVLRYFSNNGQQWLPDVVLDAPTEAPGLQPQAIRLLTTAQGENAELMVFSLEYAPSQTAATQAVACLAPARREEVRAYALSRKQGQEVQRQAPNPCLAEGQDSDTWAWLGRGYGQGGAAALITGHGQEPLGQALYFNVDKDGTINRTFPFSL